MKALPPLPPSWKIDHSSARMVLVLPKLVRLAMTLHERLFSRASAAEALRGLASVQDLDRTLNIFWTTNGRRRDKNQARLSLDALLPSTTTMSLSQDFKPRRSRACGQVGNRPFTVDPRSQSPRGKRVDSRRKKSDNK